MFSLTYNWQSSLSHTVCFSNGSWRFLCFDTKSTWMFLQGKPVWFIIPPLKINVPICCRFRYKDLHSSVIFSLFSTWLFKLSVINHFFFTLLPKRQNVLYCRFKLNKSICLRDHPLLCDLFCESLCFMRTACESWGLRLSPHYKTIQSEIRVINVQWSFFHSSSCSTWDSNIPSYEPSQRLVRSDIKMTNAANNRSHKISHTQWTGGDEESASVIIEFSVWKEGWERLNTVTCLIVLT